jgi:hypothetical protein
MKKQLLFSLSTLLLAGGLFVACNKSSSNPSSSTTGTTTSDLQTQSNDETQVTSEMDQTNNDANTALSASTSVSGSAVSASSPGITTDGGSTSVTFNNIICDASVVVDTANGLRTVTITYNGTNCWGNRTRTGVVTISIPVGIHWRDTGAVVTVDIQNLKITRLTDNKTITLNGTYTYTNVTGGLLVDLATRGTIIHQANADSVTINFADSATRIWSVARQRTFTYNDGIVLAVTGLHSDGTNTGISVWGTNRYGNSFETVIEQPMTYAQSCDFRLVSGETKDVRPAVTVDVTYGLDSNGDPVTGCPTGYFYYKAVWTIGNKTYTFIAPY